MFENKDYGHSLSPKSIVYIVRLVIQSEIKVHESKSGSKNKFMSQLYFYVT